jgi:hypothetical protein
MRKHTPFHESGRQGSTTGDATTARTETGATSLSPTVARVMQLQQLIGNRAVTRMLSGARDVVQASPTVSRAGDLEEHEADRAAAEVMGSRKAEVRRSSLGERLLRSAEGDSRGTEVGDLFKRGMASARGRGRPLPPEHRNEMEGKFGADFSRVRIHDGPTSAALAESIQARAFTHGSDIHFGRNRYEPSSRSGKSLLAHELAHTIQQGASAVGRAGKAPSALEGGPIQRVPEPAVISSPDAGVHKSNRKAVARAAQRGNPVPVLQVRDNTKHTLAEGTVVTVDFEKLDPTGNYVWIKYRTNNQTEKEGYVSKDDVKPVNYKEEPELLEQDFVLKKGVKYTYTDRSEEPLFDGPIDVNQVTQGWLADCYFIAAVSSIIKKDPNIIKSMMDDRGDHVRVRFYRQGRPEYIHVSKRVPGFEGGKTITRPNGEVVSDPYTRGPLWMILLEKAYASFQNVGYKELENGEAKQVWSHFMPVSTDFEQHLSSQSADSDQMPWLTSSLSYKRGPELEEKRKSIFTRVFNGDEGKVERWASFVRDLPRAPTASLDTVLEHFKQSNAPSDLLDLVRDYLIQNKLISGYAGSGVYSSDDIGFFAKVRKRVVEEKQVVAASSKQTYKDSKGADVDSKHGISHNHYYSVIDAKESDGLLLLTLRNPWGTGGVKYTREKIDGYGRGEKLTGEMDLTDKGIFDIELIHFLEAFDAVSFTNS